MISHYFKIIWNRKLKNSFLVAELALSFLIFSGILAFVCDKYKLYSTSLGFNPEGIYTVMTGQKINLTTIDSLEHKPLGHVITDNLKAIPGVLAVSRTGAVLPYSGSSGSRGYRLEENSDPSIYVEEMNVDKNFLEVWDVKVTKGRFFKEEDKLGYGTKKNILINGALESVLEKESYFRETFTSRYNILGTVQNFKYKSDFKEETPFIFKLKDNEEYANAYSVKVDKGVDANIIPVLYKTVEKVTKSSDFKIKNIKSERAAANKPSRIPLLTLLVISVFLITSVSMGILGILKYNLNSRIPEVGLRKVMGATVSDIQKMFVGEMLALTFVAFVIAMLFALQVPFVSILPIERSSYFLGLTLGTILVFSLVFIFSFIPTLQMARVLPANALREE